ncbi:MAG: cation:proton antiporter [Clostridia bacterium]|nr:cation:proton antiporter [Clostridia bacterium]
MLTSLALIFLVGLAMAALAQKLRLPRIIGMLLTGILLGPCVLDLLDGSILAISADLRKMALVIILIKAGLSLNIRDLKAVGRPALLLSFLPASFEILAFFLFAPPVLHITRAEAALMGSVLAAVSPAVVVPRMVRLMEERLGTGKRIPQMILAGASLDDVFVIVLFSTFTGIAQGGTASPLALAAIPVSILTGILTGAVTGMVLATFFESRYAHDHAIRNSVKVIIVLGVSFLLIALEGWLEGRLPLSGLLAVTSMACALRMQGAPAVADRLAQKFGKLWLAAEVILFVLVGAAVDIRYTLAAGAGAVLLIFLALAVRSVGVALSLTGTALDRRERLFCVISYLPKATVQAAIGSVPMALGLPCGKLILSVAVLAILITAPLGALGMDATCGKLLEKEP